jgi:hypothetical protein
MVASGSRQPLSGATKVSFNDLPKPVQHAFQNEAGTVPVESIDRGTLNGKTVYEGAFKRSGQTVKLRVAPDGTLIQDSQNSRIAAGAPLIGSRAVSLNQVPSAVQNAIQSHASGGAVESIQEGQLNGQPTYDIVVNHNGQPLHMRVAANGTVMSTSRAPSSFSKPQP